MSVVTDQNLQNLFAYLEKSFEERSFKKLIFSKKKRKDQRFRKITMVAFQKQSEYLLSLTKLDDTQSFTENLSPEIFLEQVIDFLNEQFLELNTWIADDHLSLRISKKGKTFLSIKKEKRNESNDQSHDRKKKSVELNSALLYEMGLINENGTTKVGQRAKINQVRRFVEIVLENLDKNFNMDASRDRLNIVDMGSGSAYLSLLLHQYLKENRPFEVSMKGVERRKDLVEKCMILTEKLDYKNVSFENADIIDSCQGEEMDILLALHACDIATDQALYKGITSGAKLIFCSPCCHKELRSQLKPQENISSLFSYGKHAEKLAEIITDTLRTLFLNKYGYQTKIIEFVSSEHSGKNSLIVAIKKKDKALNSEIQEKIDALKSSFGINSFSLEILLEES